MNKKALKWVALVFLPLFICGAATLKDDDASIDGVVVAMQKNHPVEEASDEINGVVVAEPCRMTATTSQLRVCTDKNTFINVVVPCPEGTLEKSGCTDGSEITCRGNNSFPGYMNCSQENVHPRPATPSTMCTLSQAVDSGKVSCDLSGDGATTTSCSLQLTNKTSEAIKTCVPRGQTFKPSPPSCQDMACSDDTICTIPPKQTINVPLPTMCISPKTSPPPPAAGVKYAPSAATLSERKLNDRLLAAATVLNGDHFYDNLPPGDAIRHRTIAQMAHWIDQGNSSKNPDDHVSPASIRDGIIYQLPQSARTKATLKALEKPCAQIYTAANATLKVAQSPKMDDLVAGVMIR